MSLLQKLTDRFTRLTDAERRQFRAEQTCSETLTGLPHVVRVFV